MNKFIAIVLFLAILATPAMAHHTETKTTSGADHPNLSQNSKVTWAHQHEYEDKDTDTNTHRTSDEEPLSFEVGHDFILKKGENDREVYSPVTYNFDKGETVIGLRGRSHFTDFPGFLVEFASLLWPLNWFK